MHRRPVNLLTDEQLAEAKLLYEAKVPVVRIANQFDVSERWLRLRLNPDLQKREDERRKRETEKRRAGVTPQERRKIEHMLSRATPKSLLPPQKPLSAEQIDVLRGLDDDEWYWPAVEKPRPAPMPLNLASASEARRLHALGHGDVYIASALRMPYKQVCEALQEVRR